MRELAADARLELLRTIDAPDNVLVQARPADPLLVHAVLEHGVVRRGRDAASDLDAAMVAVSADVALPVRYGARAYGVLAIEGTVRGADLVQLRRFADLLAFKLELHRVYAELAHREQLAAVGAFSA